MMLPVCLLSTPSCSSRSLISLHGTRAFHPLRRAIEDSHIFGERSFSCLRDGIHAQDISFSTHATRFMHSLVVERPDQSGSADSSILSPYANEYDDIVRGFSNEFVDSQHENLSCSAGERSRLHPLADNLKCLGSSDMSGTEVLHVDVDSDITNGVSSGTVSPDMLASSYSELPPTASPSGVELQNLSDTLSQSSNTSSGASLVTNDSTNIIPENSVAISETLNGTSKGSLNLKESIDNLTEFVGTSIGRAEDVVRSTYDSFVLSFSDKVKTATKSFDGAASDLFSSVGNSKEKASNEAAGFSNELKENTYKIGTLATDILRRAIITVEDSLSNATAFAVYSYGSAKALLPPDFRNALDLSEEKTVQILRPVGTALQQVYIIVEGFEEKLGLNPSDPIVPFVLFLGSSATLGISYWLFMYGGYSGELTPELTLETLKSEENAVLIDVRPEDLRERDGVPDLRRQARTKFASVTLPELDGSIRKQMKGGKDIDDALIAVVIQNLKIVKDGSKVIVMDAGGDRSKAIARSLKKLGVKNTYLVQGGFQSWVKKGLRIKELKPETTLTVLTEEAEAILEDIRPTPTLVIGYSLGIFAAGYAFLEWEKTLQIIAIIGLGQTIYQRFASYEDSDDFKKDVRLLLAPVQIGAQAVSWAAGKLEPNKIRLPISPSSTAVQDRVLQAAAKHESQPSDADAQGLPSESSEQAKKNLDISEA